MRKVYPHYDINVRDDSVQLLDEINTMPLFRPVYTMKCEKGPIGVPVWNPDYATAVANFGVETFNKNNPEYFSRASVFLMQTLPFCGAYIIRLGDASLETANSLLELELDLSAGTMTYSTRPLAANSVKQLFRDQYVPGSDIITGFGTTLATPGGGMEVLSGHDGSTGEYLPAAATVPVATSGAPIVITNSIDASDSTKFIVNIAHASELGTRGIDGDDDGGGTAADDTVGLHALEFPIYNLGNVGVLQTITAVQTLSDIPADTGAGTLAVQQDAIVGEVAFAIDMSNGIVKIQHVDAVSSYANNIEYTLDFQYDVNPEASTLYELDDVSKNLNWMFYQNDFTVTTGTPGTYVIPIMAFEAEDPGRYGNQYGFNLSTDMDSLDLSDLLLLKNVLYTLGIQYQKSTSNTVNDIRTKYGNHFFNFAMDDMMIDPSINSTIGLEVTMDRYWGAEYPCPIQPTLFGDNVQYLQNILKSVAHDVGSTVSENILIERPYSVDLFGLTTKYLNGTSEDTLNLGTELGISVIDATGTIGGGLESGSIIMLEDGSDGDTNIGGAPLDGNTYIEGLVQATWNGNDPLSMYNPEVVDNARYPFNMIIDTGYRLQTKLSIISMLAVRDDIKPVLTTWSGVDLDIANTVAGSSTLYQGVRSYPESLIYGTSSFQACIFGQYSPASNKEMYRKDLPATFWYADKMARMHNLTYIKDNPEGTTARVESQLNYPWAPYLDTSKKNLWDSAVNYAQYYSRTGLHFPSLRSVYEHESSLFTNDSFVNMVLYVKQLLPEVWANHVGRTDFNEVVYTEVLAELDAKLDHLLSGKANFTTRMYQTASEKKAGFEHHIAIELFDDLGQRIWHYDIIGKRATPAV